MWVEQCYKPPHDWEMVINKQFPSILLVKSPYPFINRCTPQTFILCYWTALKIGFPSHTCGGCTIIHKLNWGSRLKNNLWFYLFMVSRSSTHRIQLYLLNSWIPDFSRFSSLLNILKPTTRTFDSWEYSIQQNTKTSFVATEPLKIPRFPLSWNTSLSLDFLTTASHNPQQNS